MDFVDAAVALTVCCHWSVKVGGREKDRREGTEKGLQDRWVVIMLKQWLNVFGNQDKGVWKILHLPFGWCGSKSALTGLLRLLWAAMIILLPKILPWPLSQTLSNLSIEENLIQPYPTLSTLTIEPNRIQPEHWGEPYPSAKPYPPWPLNQTVSNLSVEENLIQRYPSA